MIGMVACADPLADISMARTKIISPLFAGLVLALIALGGSADAQQRYYSGHRSGGFFDSLFGGGGGGGSFNPPPERQYGEPQSGGGDSSRAPAAKKSETTPTLSVMVLGDSMADWLGYGLEEAFADAPEIGVTRKVKTNSGLIRYEQRSDLDWWHVARDLLGKDKVDYVVMMMGINDRQSLRETAADKKAKEAAKEAPKDGTQPAQAAKPDDDEAIVAPEPSRGGGPSLEFRSERWEQIYTKRVDETIAALKSKGVPVLWIGLPPIRGTRSTADVQYLNQLYRARAEAQGVLYVDVWDGFVDEGGKFTYQGPDFEGQTRRLRAGDGVHFTKQGARKLAHYVERELRRFMSNRAMPMAMPSGTQPGAATPSEPAARPVAGPVVPLTAPPTSSEELLGGRNNQPAHSDATATRVLVKGEPVPSVPGRADDFQWPRGGDASAAVEPLSPTAAAARAEPPATPKGAAAKKGAQEAARGDTAKTPDKPAEKREQASSRRSERNADADQRARARAQQPPPGFEPRRNTGIFGGLFR
jgi:hypothetical protein